MMKKKILNYTILFFILLLLELVLLTASFAIPREYIRENVLVSAEYLCEKAPFYRLIPSDASSRIDRHADAILVNLAWSCDDAHPLQSALKSAYYFDYYANENDNLLYAVTNDAAPTLDYMRYWHGSLVVLRPLLTLFTLPQIYVLCAVVLAVLFACACILIYRNFGRFPCFGFIFAACACSVFYVPFSLEYVPVFFLTFLSVPVTIYLLKNKPEYTGMMFFVLGSLTAYTDFLTSETLTCLLPLILVILKVPAKPLLTCVKNGVSWLLGYGLTWASKWLLYSVILGKNGFSDALTQTMYRTGGEAVSGGLISQIFGALLRNLRCLFPFSLVKDPAGMVSVVIVLVLLLMIYWLVRRQKNMPSCVPALWLIGILPYVRYAVLSNHAYLHYFFTYRAQFASVFCLFLIFWLGTDTEFLKKELKKHKKRK